MCGVVFFYFVNVIKERWVKKSRLFKYDVLFFVVCIVFLMFFVFLDINVLVNCLVFFFEDRIFILLICFLFCGFIVFVVFISVCLIIFVIFIVGLKIMVGVFFYIVCVVFLGFWFCIILLGMVMMVFWVRFIFFVSEWYFFFRFWIMLVGWFVYKEICFCFFLFKFLLF